VTVIFGTTSGTLILDSSGTKIGWIGSSMIGFG